MTSEEVKEILAILKAAYPHSYQTLTKRDANAMINLWARQFAGESQDAVIAAVENLIATRTAGFSPTIGEVKEQLHRLRTVSEMTESEAWAMVEKACRRGLYNAQEEFDKLPPSVQATVGGPEQLKAWARMDEETVCSVIASNFRRSFRVTQDREKEKAMMPPSVRAFVEGVASQMHLGSKAAEGKELASSLKPTALPMPLKPMTFTAQPKPEQEKQPEYTPLTEGEFEAKREAALARLRANCDGKETTL